jgi:hypothetical protein
MQEYCVAEQPYIWLYDVYAIVLAKQLKDSYRENIDDNSVTDYKLWTSMEQDTK